jgi:hypothetical protein
MWSLRSISASFLSILLTLTSNPAGADPDASRYDALLARAVSNGRVDYGVVAEGRAELDSYLKALATAKGLSLAGQLNAYNALVLVGLLDAGVPAQVTDIKGFFDEKRYRIAGKAETLNGLERAIRDHHDPRIHFALNCGARSCPPLHNRAFVQQTLDSTLSLLTARFLARDIQVDDVSKRVFVTKLFDWYRDDFIVKEGSVEAFIEHHLRDAPLCAKVHEAFAEHRSVVFKPYDWHLNRR